MTESESIWDSVREWIAAAGGVLTKDDLRLLEGRLEELEELVDVLENQIAGLRSQDHSP